MQPALLDVVQNETVPASAATAGALRAARMSFPWCLSAPRGSPKSSRNWTSPTTGKTSVGTFGGAATPAAAATHVTTDARRSARLIRGSSPPVRRTLARPADRVRNADEDRGMRQASPRVAGEEARRGDEATGPLRRGDAELVRRKRGRGGAATEGGGRRRRGRARVARARQGARCAAQGARDGRRPRRPRQRRRRRRLRSRRHEPRAREGARARGRRSRAVRAAGGRLRRRRPLGRRRRPAAPSRRLAGGRADALGREGAREAPDRVRLRRDRRAALSVAEGDHGREEEAAGVDRHGRARTRRVAGRPGGLEDGSARARRSSRAWRDREDRGRRQQRGEDRRVPRGEAAAVKSLVFLEHHGDEFVKNALGVLSKAATLGDVDAAVTGSGVRDLAARAGKFGAATVHVADDPSLEAPLPQPRVDVLAQLVRDGGYDTVLFGQSVLAADVASALAARLDAGLNWDLTDLGLVDGVLIGKRPALQDTVLVDVGWKSEPRLALFRSGAFDPRETGGDAEVTDVTVQLEDFSTQATMVEQAHAESSGPSIEDADVIVAGGRGLGGPENFELAESLARALGGAVAATRAVVDAGWYPYSAQVGQTGKTVSPKLYVALGISGAIQHKVGMQGAGTIVAINKDANAPIFEFADLGVVGDLHQIVPKLTELVQQRKA